MYLVVAFRVSVQGLDLAEAPCLGLRKVTRLIAAIGGSTRYAEGIDGQTVPARPWPDEKPAEGQGWPRTAGAAAFVADLCDVSDRLDDERLASRTCRNGGGCTRREPGASSS